MTALTAYIDAWVANDTERITSTVTTECVVTESYGPVYRGRDTVRQWADAWFGAGGIVHRWEVTDHVIAGDREFAEWTFECTWEGKRWAFDGATISRSDGGLILTLREFQTTEALYDWSGTWR